MQSDATVQKTACGRRRNDAPIRYFGKVNNLCIHLPVCIKAFQPTDPSLAAISVWPSIRRYFIFCFRRMQISTSFTNKLSRKHEDA